MANNIRFINGSKVRVLECHLKAIEISTTRAELVAIYKASKVAFGKSPELKQITEACKVKQESLNNAKS